MDEFDQKMEISEQPQEEIVEKIPGRDVYETVSSLVSALLVVVLVFTFLVRLMGVSGPSMIPTLQDGDYVALLILGQGPDDSTADEAKLAQDEAAKVDAAWQDIFGSAANQLVVK